MANSLFPMQCVSSSILTFTLLSKSLVLSVWQLGLKNVEKTGLNMSSSRDNTISILASSSAFLPRRSFLLDFRTMYLAMAFDSVSLKSPLMRYGRLGNSRPSLVLSPPPNHWETSLQVTSSQSRPVQVSKSRRTCPLPLIAQYPSLSLPSISIRYDKITVTLSQHDDANICYMLQSAKQENQKELAKNPNKTTYATYKINMSFLILSPLAQSTSCKDNRSNERLLSDFYSIWHYLNIYYFYFQYCMTETEEQIINSLSNLTLTEILEKESLNIDFIFSVRDILGKVKRQMKLFIAYCQLNEGFTKRMIQLGFKSPITQASTPQLKNLVYVSSDILTSDHQYIANLLIMTNNSNKYDSDDESQIAEEIETEENIHQVAEQDKYKYLNQVLNYIQGNELEENCINYIMKCLQNLVRKKLNAFLEYFALNPHILQRIIQISHYPSVARFLAKLLTDDEDDMTPSAIYARHRIIPFLIQKIRDEIAAPQTMEVLQCIEQVLNSSRYGDSEERSALQKMSDAIVAEAQITFHILNIQNGLCKVTQAIVSSISNSIAYLNLLMARINMDVQSEYPQQMKSYRPTLRYSQSSFFPFFCKLVSFLEPLQQIRRISPSNFKLLYIKLIDLLILITKHFAFGQYYSLISKEERINAIRLLISRIASRQLPGIMLQTTSTILQKIIVSQQKFSQSNPESPNKVSPSELYKIISQNYETLNETTRKIMQETSNQRNRNEQGIYLRKLLVVLDNFFKNKQIQKSFPEVQNVSNLIPAFNLHSCKQFTDLTAVVKHPAYTKKTPEQFVFIERNRNYLRQFTAQEINTSKIKAEQQIQLQQALKQSQKQAILSPKKASNSTVIQLSSEMQAKVTSPNRSQVAPQPCLLFFIRHLAIY